MALFSVKARRSEKLEQLKSFFDPLKSILVVIVFGSYGTAREKNGKSDIDLAVAQKRPMSAQEKVQLITRISSRFDREVD